MNKPADLFHKPSPGERAADSYFADHLIHTERECEYRDKGQFNLADEEHKAALIALRAYNGEMIMLRSERGE